MVCRAERYYYLAARAKAQHCSSCHQTASGRTREALATVNHVLVRLCDGGSGGSRVDRARPAHARVRCGECAIQQSRLPLAAATLIVWGAVEAVMSLVALATSCGSATLPACDARDGVRYGRQAPRKQAGTRRRSFFSRACPVSSTYGGSRSRTRQWLSRCPVETKPKRSCIRRRDILTKHCFAPRQAASCLVPSRPVELIQRGACHAGTTLVRTEQLTRDCNAPKNTRRWRHVVGGDWHASSRLE